MNEDLGNHEHEATIVQCLNDHYGIEGSLSRLPGENINYLVTVDDDERYVLKIVGKDMPSEVVAMEYAAIEHAVSNGFGLNVPRILKNKHNKIESGINIRKKHQIRLLLYNFIDGNLLSTTTFTAIITTMGGPITTQDTGKREVGGTMAGTMADTMAGTMAIVGSQAVVTAPGPVTVARTTTTLEIITWSRHPLARDSNKRTNSSRVLGFRGT